MSLADNIIEQIKDIQKVLEKNQKQSYKIEMKFFEKLNQKVKSEMFNKDPQALDELRDEVKELESIMGEVPRFEDIVSLAVNMYSGNQTGIMERELEKLQQAMG
jgi:hypothetical protein